MSDLPVTEYALKIREEYRTATPPTQSQLREDQLWNCTEYPVHTQNSSTYGGSDYGYTFTLSFSERFPGIPTYDAFNTRTIDVFRKFFDTSTGAIAYKQSYPRAIAPREFTVDDATSELYGVSNFDGGNTDIHTVRFNNNQLLIEKSSRNKMDRYCGGKITDQSLGLSILGPDLYCDDWHRSHSDVPAITSVDHYSSSKKSVAHSYSVCTPSEPTSVSKLGQR